MRREAAKFKVVLEVRDIYSDSNAASNVLFLNTHFVPLTYFLYGCKYFCLQNHLPSSENGLRNNVENLTLFSDKFFITKNQRISI